MAVISGGLINCLRFFASQNFSTHCAVADKHCHVIDRGVLWERKGVDRFNLFTERIFEFLRDGYARKKSADFSFYVSMFQWTDGFRCSVRSDDLKRALSGSILGGDVSARPKAAWINEEKNCRNRNGGD